MPWKECSHGRRELEWRFEEHPISLSLSLQALFSTPRLCRGLAVKRDKDSNRSGPPTWRDLCVLGGYQLEERFSNQVGRAKYGLRIQTSIVKGYSRISVPFEEGWTRDPPYEPEERFLD